MAFIDPASYPIPPEFSDDDPIARATAILDLYRSEIAQAIERGLAPAGFCQGVIFLEATEVVIKAARKCGLFTLTPRALRD